MDDATKQDGPSPEQQSGSDVTADTTVGTDTKDKQDTAFPELGTSEGSASYTGDSQSKEHRGHSIEALLNVDLEVTVVLGDSKMPISNLLKLSRGSVIELEQRIGEPVRIVVNSKTVARGELVKLAGERLGVSLTEIVREHIGHD
ncbi:FliM/FliN family flagellar motor switch protein [Roseivivax sp. CAU 1753]